MAEIRILPDRVANQIAAGEVIERPAAVIKELVENALDAGATRIDVEFRQGGRAHLGVADNGRGLSRDDALLALERHATSKIAEAADLDRLTTFGFRGEALPSIASVSRFTLQTRAAGADSGTEVLVNAGKLIHVRDCGRPVGTSVEAAHLFHPVPARRKFLKSDATEAAHIVECVRLYALASPSVAFTLVGDEREIFRSPECRTLAERIGEILGRQFAELLMPIDATEGGMRLSGLIGRPGASRGSRHETITYVNGRPVDSRTLYYALLEGCRDSVPKGRYPPAVIFFECDPAAVDVNVHPAAKREVRFRSEAAVRAFVVGAVKATVAANPVAVGTATVAAGLSSSPTVARVEHDVPKAPLWPAMSRSALETPSPDRPRSATRSAPGHAPAEFPPPSAASYPISASPSIPAVAESTALSWRFVGLAHSLYALFETPAGIVLLDRRAAHERVWYERLREQFRSGQVPSQRLLLPVPLELDPIAAALLLDRREFLQAHGFELAEFGRGFFRIEGLPDWMEPADAETFVRDLLGALREGRLAEKDLDLARDELARLAAARAVRLAAAPGEEELRALAADLFATRSPLTTPAGRPTFIELNRGELARRLQKS